MIKYLMLLTSLLALAVSTAQACKQNPVSHSANLINFILEDVRKTYLFQGGGGIGEIKLLKTDHFRVSLLRENVVDDINYVLTTQADCKVVLLNKVMTTRNMEPAPTK